MNERMFLSNINAFFETTTHHTTYTHAADKESCCGGHWAWVCVFWCWQRPIGGWTWGKAVASSREHPASPEPAWRACGMWCLSRAAGTGPRSRAAPPRPSPAWSRISAWARAAWPGPSPTACPPLHTTPLQPAAKLQRHPPANASVAPCPSPMSSAASARLGGLRAPGCGRQWRRGGATVEGASELQEGEEEEGVSPAAIFPPCSGAPASACPHAPASRLTDASTCLSSTSSCLRTPSSPPRPSPPPPRPRTTTIPATTTSYGPSPSPTSRSACPSCRRRRRRRPAPRTPPQSWGGVPAKGRRAPGVCPGAGPSLACWMIRRSAWSGGDQKMPRSSGPPWTWQRWLRLAGNVKHMSTRTGKHMHTLIWIQFIIRLSLGIAVVHWLKINKHHLISNLALMLQNVLYCMLLNPGQTRLSRTQMPFCSWSKGEVRVIFEHNWVSLRVWSRTGLNQVELSFLGLGSEASGLRDLRPCREWCLLKFLMFGHAACHHALASPAPVCHYIYSVG